MNLWYSILIDVVDGYCSTISAEILQNLPQLGLTIVLIQYLNLETIILYSEVSLNIH